MRRGKRRVAQWGEEFGQRPTRYVHPGLKLIQPLGQGDYDGLCGLYSILNAIRLAAAPTRVLSHKHTQKLFIGGVRFLEQRDLLHRAVSGSIERRRWLTLTEFLRREARLNCDLSLRYEWPFEAEEETQPTQVLDAIEQILLQRKAVMAFLRGTYRHYSVISGYTPSSLTLFDSYGYRWLRKASCVATTTEPARHHIHAPSLIAVSVL